MNNPRSYTHLRAASISVRCVCAALLAALVLPAQAVIIADFADGNGTDTSNQFPGTAGDGWLNGWNTGTSGSGISLADTTVSNTTPFPGKPAGTNYLDVQQIRTGTATRQGTFWRTYGNYGGVQVSGDHQVEIMFRANDISGMKQTNNVFTIADTSDTSFSSTFAFVNGNYSWNMHALWQSDPELSLEFRMRGGNAQANTGIYWENGSVYHLLIDINSADHQFTGTLTNITANETFTTTLPMKDAVAGNLAFMLNSTAPEDIDYDIQSVEIIPEPALLPLLVGGLIGLVVFLRRRR